MWPYSALFRLSLLSSFHTCLCVCVSGCLGVCVWMSGCLCVCVSGCLGVCVSGCLDVWVYVCLGVCVSGCLDVWVSGCMQVLWMCQRRWWLLWGFLTCLRSGKRSTKCTIARVPSQCTVRHTLCILYTMTILPQHVLYIHSLPRQTLQEKKNLPLVCVYMTGAPVSCKATYIDIKMLLVFFLSRNVYKCMTRRVWEQGYMCCCWLNKLKTESYQLVMFPQLPRVS